MSQLPSSGKILALDLGQSRTGVAITDLKQRVAFLRDPIESSTSSELIKQISSLATEEGVSGLLVGMPHSLSGDESSQETWTKNFLEKLRLELNTPIQTMDERLTTQIAKKRMTDVPDSEAARVLLETYLDSFTPKAE